MLSALRMRRLRRAGHIGPRRQKDILRLQILRATSHAHSSALKMVLGPLIRNVRLYPCVLVSVQEVASAKRISNMLTP